MNAEYFLQLVLHPAEMSVTDLQTLEEMNRKYPYCQLIQFLIAKIYHDINSQQLLPHLKQAALYATHREALKALLERKPQTLLAMGRRTPFSAFVPPDKETDREMPPEIARKPEIEHADAGIRKDGFITLETDLQLTVDETQFSEDTLTVNPILRHSKPEPADERATIVPDLGNLEMEEAVNDFLLEQVAEIDETEEPPLKLGFLNATEETTAKNKLGKDEQMEIIENFIKKDPRISSLNYVEKEEYTAKKDLSEKNIAAEDGFVSESLANIMVKQGKIQRAIEIFEKLMLKNPAKRPYFATRIDELKKNLNS